MTEKYDGWVLKAPKEDGGFLYVNFFYVKRTDVIKRIDRTVGEGYKNWNRGRGKDYKIVKVKLVEMEK